MYFNCSPLLKLQCTKLNLPNCEIISSFRRNILFNKIFEGMVWVNPFSTDVCISFIHSIICVGKIIWNFVVLVDALHFTVIHFVILEGYTSPLPPNVSVIIQFWLLCIYTLFCLQLIIPRGLAQSSYSYDTVRLPTLSLGKINTVRLYIPGLEKFKKKADIETNLHAYKRTYTCLLYTSRCV